ncbi:MAG: Uma2 family endonuclease [Candidatus Binatia bacterium]
MPMPTLTDRLPPGPLTYEDYLELPDDGKQYEILDGELFVTPAPVPRHQRVSRNLQWILEAYVRAHRVGEILDAPIDVILAPTTVAQPDLLFIRSGRESIVTERAVEGPPDLVVEIVSPSSSRKDRTTKAMLYARFGIENFWIVDPDERTFEIWQLAGGSYRRVARGIDEAAIEPNLFPGLVISLRQIWA